MSGRQGHPLRYFGGIYHAELRSREVRGLDRHAFTLWLYLQASTSLHDGQVLELEAAVSEIADRFAVHRSTVRRWARGLEDAGLVERVHRTAWGPDGEHHLPVIWRLLIPASVARALDDAAAKLEEPPVEPEVIPTRARNRSTRRDRRRAERLLKEARARLAELEAAAIFARAVPNGAAIAADIARIEGLIAVDPALADRYGDLLEESRRQAEVIADDPGRGDAVNGADAAVLAARSEVESLTEAAARLRASEVERLTTS